MVSSTKGVNAAPTWRPGLTFATLGTIAFAMPFTACAGSRQLLGLDRMFLCWWACGSVCTLATGIRAFRHAPIIVELIWVSVSARIQLGGNIIGYLDAGVRLRLAARLRRRRRAVLRSRRRRGKRGHSAAFVSLGQSLIDCRATPSLGCHQISLLLASGARKRPLFDEARASAQLPLCRGFFETVESPASQ